MMKNAALERARLQASLVIEEEAFHQRAADVFLFRQMKILAVLFFNPLLVPAERFCYGEERFIPLLRACR